MNERNPPIAIYFTNCNPSLLGRGEARKAESAFLNCLPPSRAENTRRITGGNGDSLYRAHAPPHTESGAARVREGSRKGLRQLELKHKLLPSSWGKGAQQCLIWALP